MVSPLELRKEIMERGGMPWYEVYPWAWETPGLYTRREEDYLLILSPEKQALAILDLNGDLLYVADEEVWK